MLKGRNDHRRAYRWRARVAGGTAGSLGLGKLGSTRIEVRRLGPSIVGVGLLSWMAVWGYREEALAWLLLPVVEVSQRIYPYTPPDLGLDPRPSLFLVSVCLATTFAFFTTLPMLMGLVWAIARPASFAALRRSLWQFRLLSYVVLALAVWYLRSALVPQLFAHLMVDSMTVPIGVAPTNLLKEYVGFAAARLVVYSLAALFGIFSVFVSRARRGSVRRRIGGLLPLGVLCLAFVSVSAVILPMQSALHARWILPMAALYALCLLASLLPHRPEIRRSTAER